MAASLCLASIAASSNALSLTRCDVIADAQSWVDAVVPYCQGPGGYYCTSCDPCYYDPLRGGECFRSDCSGYVSATWGLGSPGPATGGLCATGESISWDSLEPGDALVACADHAMLFAGWTVAGVKFNAYEESTCGNPAHLAEHDRYADPYWGNMEGYPFQALRLPGIQPCPAADAPPAGWLDAVSCDSIGGWSQDPDVPAAPVDVHVYFDGPAGSGAPAIAVHANVPRNDLCTAIGSCEHGFGLSPPLSLFNGQPHPIRAYGIDLNGPSNAELSGSPKDLNCPPTIPAGVRRHVLNPDSFAAWKLDEFRDTLPAGDPQIATLSVGEDLPATPKLVQADDGTPEVWVADGTHRRHVPNPDVMAAWSFDSSAVQKVPASEVNALAQGPAWRTRPLLLHRGDGTIWLVDDPFDGQAGSAAADAGGRGNSGLDGSSEQPGDGSNAGGDGDSCACNAVGSGSRAGDGSVLLAAAGVLALIRRRRRAQ